MQFTNTKDYALQLDREDPLKGCRDQFIVPREEGREQIYFLGNSLGLQPRNARAEIDAILQQWSDYGVEGFFRGKTPWMDYHDQLTKPLSVIVGCKPQEISVMNQLTVNLHLMMVSFYRPAGKKIKILCEAKAFPSDQYMFETHVKHHGYNPDNVLIEVKPRDGEQLLRKEDILSAIETHQEELALVLLGGLNYYSGQVLDMETITRAAHAAGIKVGFDLAHAAGNIPLSLHDWDIDFACWCSYKYLNAGPGAMGAVFIHERFHQDPEIHRFAGWWGYQKDKRFKMEKGFLPIGTAEGWQISTPSLFLYATQKAALEVVENAGWEQILQKQKKLTAYLWLMLDDLNAALPEERKIRIITPRNEQERGCQVSLLFPENGRAIFEFLGKNGIMTDWREPNVIRMAPVPLYNRYTEIWTMKECLQKMLAI
ncbi:MAG: kynureninase [Terrimonas sp.]|nr:kynureninase [Terrimonas sp.]